MHVLVYALCDSGFFKLRLIGRQYYIAVDCEEWKLDRLCDLYNDISITSSVIFWYVLSCFSFSFLSTLTQTMEQHSTQG